MGYRAVMSLIEGKGNRVVVTQDGRVTDMDLEEGLQMAKPFPMDRYQILESLSCRQPGLF